MHYTIPSIIAFASLATAAPAPADPWKGVIDPWGKYGSKPENTKRADIEIFDDSTSNSTTMRIAGTEFSPDELINLAKRATISSFAGKIPGCDSKDDPSNKDTPKPSWPVNHGVKIPKDGKDDECTHGTGGNHCWNEYYLVEAAVEYFSWLPTGSAINCPKDKDGSCGVDVTSLAQSCTTTGTTTTKSTDWKIIDASAALGIGFGEGVKNSVDLSAGTSYTKSWATTQHDLTNTCRSDASTAHCNWKGGSDCHQVWYADRVLHVWGQAQRVCNKCSGDGVQQNTGDGNVCVRGQKEFDLRLPINKLVHCDGACNSNNPGVNQPPNGPRAPYIAPNNWDLLVIGKNNPQNNLP